jgi:hypothetical protein
VSLESFQKNYEKKDDVPSRVLQTKRSVAKIQPTEKVAQQPERHYLKEKKSTIFDEPFYANRAKPNDKKTLITGYTGFVPHLQHHFGQPYAESVRKSIHGFNNQIEDLAETSQQPRFLNKASGAHKHPPKFDNRPIPGEA